MKWLKRFPTTPALCLSGILMAWVTCFAVLCGWKPPEGWFLFVAGFATVGGAQFTAKRMTWKPESPQNRELD